MANIQKTHTHTHTLTTLHTSLPNKQSFPSVYTRYTAQLIPFVGALKQLWNVGPLLFNLNLIPGSSEMANLFSDLHSPKERAAVQQECPWLAYYRRCYFQPLASPVQGFQVEDVEDLGLRPQRAAAMQGRQYWFRWTNDCIQYKAISEVHSTFYWSSIFNISQAWEVGCYYPHLTFGNQGMDAWEGGARKGSTPWNHFFSVM